MAFVERTNPGKLALLSAKIYHSVPGQPHRFSAPSPDDSTLPSSTTTTTNTAIPPWSNPDRIEQVKQKRRNNKTRFRQHVNPLAIQYQQHTILSDAWPQDVFDDCSKPLFLDIGCSKGGFLIKYVNATAASDYNYLGLEVRPMVAAYAKERIAVHNLTGKLDFLGCNANVDLDRILNRYGNSYQEAFTRITSSAALESSSPAAHCLHGVTIQFPDPHFKSHHAKRRMVTPELVNVLAKHCLTGSHYNGDDHQTRNGGAFILLQSDVQSVLDEMRRHFRKNMYFVDTLAREDEYLPDNPLGVPTERELSVLNRNLPVYRAMFIRNEKVYAQNERNQDELQTWK